MLYLNTLGPVEIYEDGRPIRIARAKDRALFVYLALNRPQAFTRDFLADLLWAGSDESRSKHSLSQSLYTLRRIVPSAIMIDRNIRVDSVAVKTDIDEFDQVEPNIVADFGLRFLQDLQLIDAPEFESWRDQFVTRLTNQQDRITVRKDIKRIPASQMPNNRLSIISTPNPQRVAQSEQRDSGTFPFVGRTDQLNKLSEFLAESTTGRPTFTVIRGKPGYGKTSIVNEFIRRHSNDIRLLESKCYDSERRIGFAPLIRALEPHMDRNIVSSMGPIWTSSLGELFPDLRSGSLGDPPRLEAPAAQTRLFEAIGQLLQRLSETKTTILFLDDVQWSDHSTLAALAYLSHRLVLGRIMTIVVKRTQVRGELPQWSDWRSLEVSEFTEQETIELISQIGATDNAKAHQIFKSTSGHPYLVNELLGNFEPANGSDVANVRAFVSNLLRTLPPACQHLAAVAAVLGRPAPVKLVARVLKSRNIAEPLDDLIENGLMAFNERTVSLRHDIIREVAYTHIPPFTRAALHKRVAEALGRTSPARSGERAEHYYKAGERNKAFSCALKASELADSRHAYAESAFFLRLAIRSKRKKSIQLRWKLVEHLERIHLFNAAYGELLEASRIVDGDVPEEMRFKRLELGFRIGEVAYPSLARELDLLLNTTSDDRLAIRILSLGIRVAYHAGELESTVDYARRLENIAATLQPIEDGFEARTNAARVLGSMYSSVEANRSVSAVEARINDITDHESRIRTVQFLAHIKYEVGELRKAAELFESCMKQSDDVGAIGLWPKSASHAHMVHVELGNYSRAFELEAEFEARSSQFEATNYVTVEMCCNSAQMHLEMGNMEQVLEKVHAGIEHVRPAAALWIEFGLRSYEGLALLELGKVHQATKIAEEVRLRRDQIGLSPGDVSQVEILQARIAALNGRRDQAIERLSRHINEYSERDVTCRIRLQLELAKMLRTSDRQRARSLAKEVYETARSIGARPLAERADSLLMRI